MALDSLLAKMMISGREVWPIIEGGKGVAVSTGASAGAFAEAGAVGTFSGIRADVVNENGEYVPLEFKSSTRLERHEELVQYSIEGAISQARIAHETSKGNGRIHMNVLWEAGGTMRVLHGTLAGAKGLVHGITCGAGMPYGLGALASQYEVYYYPIISSTRVFKILWQRAYSKHSAFLGGIVYEDPWLAGGHNGLSNKEDPNVVQDPYDRVAEIRSAMDAVGLSEVPIIMAGGVWHLKEWARFIDSAAIGKIAFQFGTRPIVTQESTVPDTWKRKLLDIKSGEVVLNSFSPTGFYSSAVNNQFLRTLQDRSSRQVEYKDVADAIYSTELAIGSMGRSVFITPEDKVRVDGWRASGYIRSMKTPSASLIFVTDDEWSSIRSDQIACKGCLSQCRFSNWMEDAPHNTGVLPDPRSFCIINTLTSIAHEGDMENQLMFSGHNAYRFADDPLYANGYIPTVRELVDKILVGE